MTVHRIPNLRVTHSSTLPWRHPPFRTDPTGGPVSIEIHTGVAWSPFRPVRVSRAVGYRRGWTTA